MMRKGFVDSYSLPNIPLLHAARLSKNSHECTSIVKK